MNILNFDNRINDIDQTLGEVKTQLKQDQQLAFSIRKKFNLSLESVLKLLDGDSDYMLLPKSNWHIAHRVVQLRNLQMKISNIRNRILKLKRPHYFTKKIQKKILPPLSKRIKEVKQYIGSIDRLPFNAGMARDNFFNNVNQKLQLTSGKETESAEIEFFHLLGNSLDSRGLKEINIDPYEGSDEISSLVSWSQIISQFILEGRPIDVFIGKIVLDLIQKATPIALKTSYVYSLPNKKSLDVTKQEDTFYQDFEEFSKEKERASAAVSPNSIVSSDDNFSRKYTLNEKNQIPLHVLMNEIAWDIGESINQIKILESRVFILGTRRHSIVIQITCMQTPSKICPQGHFKYKIFNTGNGVQNHRTKVEGGETRVKPVTFHDLPRSAFSYFFISELVRLTLQESTVDEFYKLHDQVLVGEAGGRKDLDNGAWYLTQIYGTCVYSAFEAFIQSYLSDEQIKHVELIKAKMSTNKQKKVITILEQETQEANWITVTKKGNVVSPTFTKKKRKLEENKLLLDLGQRHLEKVKKDFCDLKEKGAS
jgi:hypothetical protein